MLDAHPLDKHLTFGLVLFFDNAFRRGFLKNGFLRNLPTAPVIEFAVTANDRRAVFAMGSPDAALTLRPYVSYKEDKPVDEAELRSEREIGLKLFSRALREVAQPARKRLPA